MTQVLAWSLNLPWKDSVTDNFHLDPFYRHHFIIRSSNHFLFPITHPQTCTSALPMLSILPQSRVPFFANNKHIHTTAKPALSSCKVAVCIYHTPFLIRYPNICLSFFFLSLFHIFKGHGICSIGI